MWPIPDNGRLLLFAELAPRFATPSMTGTAPETEVVALAIFEYPTIAVPLLEDADGRLVYPSGQPVDFSAPFDHGDNEEGRPTLGYCVLELSAQGQVVDDWEPGDLEQARGFLRSYPRARWEELPGDPTDARVFVEQRLATLRR